MKKLRESGIHLLGARNATLRPLVLTMPPPVAAHARGHQGTQPTSRRGSAVTQLSRHMDAREVSSNVRGSAQNEMFHQRLLCLSSADNRELDQVRAFLYLSPHKVIRLLPHG